MEGNAKKGHEKCQREGLEGTNEHDKLDKAHKEIRKEWGGGAMRDGE